MSDIEDIRRQKREQLRGELQGDESANEETTTVPDEPIHVTDADHFREVTERYDAVLVDFYADWCGPCKQLEPIVERVAAATDGVVAKVDIDTHQQLARQFQVRGVPTMLLFVDGEPTERVVGLRGEDHLTSLIDQHT